MATTEEIKAHLLRWGLWAPVEFSRRLPDVVRWLRSGCAGVAPAPVKLLIVNSYRRRYSLARFVETGTYLGDTLAHIAQSGIPCTSIELSQELYDRARRRFAHFQNVTLVHGDSGFRLPEVLRAIDRPTLFWLDGHYSGGFTALGESSTPVSAELRAILDHPVKSHVILIDDARCFDGTNDYPHLDELLRSVREEGTYQAEVSTDIIRIVPRAR